ncbi:MAG: alpha/beta fold hydrolase [Candidatus Marinimicrobia bacterium]|nr:alpha/beta fold hydrolase [Candidatus Neomarinimicrobiota bacterium]
MLVQLNDHEMNLVRRGDSTGLPIIFIHGFPFSHAMWEPQLSVLPPSYNAIAYDIRGHGRSAVGDGLYTIELFVDDLLALMDYLELEQAVACGLSMGGYIALRAIERHPERFNGLILADTRSVADNDEARINRAGVIKSVMTKGVEAFAADFVKLVFAPQSLTARLEQVEFIKQIICTTDPRAIGGTLLALAARTDTTNALPKIDVPTLLMVGEHDALTSPSASEHMAGFIPGAEFHVIPEAGHLSNLENAPVFNRHLLDYLGKLEQVK